MGNQFIQMNNGKQVLVSFHGIQRRSFIHGDVVDSHKDMYLVRERVGNGAYQLYHCPIGDYARPQSAADTVELWADGCPARKEGRNDGRGKANES